MLMRVAMRPSGEFSAISAASFMAPPRTSRLRHQHVGEAHGIGFIARHAAAGIEHQRRLGRADHRRQSDGQPEAGMKAEPGEIGAEARLRAGDAEIRHHGKAKPAADRRAMHGGDDRLLGAEQPVALDIERRTAWAAGSVRPAAAFLVEQSSRRRNWRRRKTPCPARPARWRGHCRPHRRPRKRLAMSWISANVEEIVGRTPDLDQRHMTGFFDADISHCRLPSCEPAAARPACAMSRPRPISQVPTSAWKLPPALPHSSSRA